MKTTGKKRLALVFAAATMLASCSQNEETNDAGAPAGDSAATASLKALTTCPPSSFSEMPSSVLTLSLCSKVVTSSTADLDVPRAYAKIRREPGTPLSPLEERVCRKAMDDLNNAIVSAHPGTHTGCRGFVPALKITLGLDGSELKLYYTALYLCTTSTVVNTGIAFSITTAFSTNSYSTAAGEQFTAVTGTPAAIAEYTANIKFIEAGGTRTFNPSYDGGGDSRSLIVPLQAIDAMLRQNQDSPEFVIWNYLLELPAGENRIRHTLLIGPHQMRPDHGEKLKLFGAFTAAYANRSHLCPPSCSVVSLVVSDNTQEDCQD